MSSKHNNNAIFLMKALREKLFNNRIMPQLPDGCLTFRQRSSYHPLIPRGRRISRCHYAHRSSGGKLETGVPMNVLLIARLNANPIARAEMLHQQRANIPPRRWRRWLTRGVYLLALVTAMIFFWGELAGALLMKDTKPLYEQPG